LRLACCNQFSRSAVVLEPLEWIFCIACRRSKLIASVPCFEASRSAWTWRWVSEHTRILCLEAREHVARRPAAQKFVFGASSALGLGSPASADPDTISKLMELFQRADRDGLGAITWSDFNTVFVAGDPADVAAAKQSHSEGFELVLREAASRELLRSVPSGLRHAHTIRHFSPLPLWVSEQARARSHPTLLCAFSPPPTCSNTCTTGASLSLPPSLLPPNACRRCCSRTVPRWPYSAACGSPAH